MALQREIGLGGAVFLGLGSIVGTGVFVSLGIAAGITGPSVVLAVAVAGLVATFNGLSSAQLAAAFPVSGGTYEYAQRTLGRAPGLVAGWTFLIAKSASAATAALGAAAYLGWPSRVLAIGLVAITTVLCAGGMRRSARANAIIVSITLIALVVFAAHGLASADRFPMSFDGGTRGFLEATALVFVAFTGYGRIATLGEEVRDPARTIPRAILVTLAATVLLYALVAATLVVRAGVADLDRGNPLQAIAAPWVRPLVSAGAVTAMLGVLLNLVLGLSRVVLAMARRRDLPTALAAEDAGTPRRAVIAVGVAIAAIAAIGRIELAWTVSAATVLVYYAITNAAALRLPREQRRYPRAIAVLGLASCLALAVWAVVHLMSS